MLESELFPSPNVHLTTTRYRRNQDVLVPEIKSGKKVLIAAHGNSLRALVKHLDNISAEEICELNIPTGIPLVYELVRLKVSAQRFHSAGCALQCKQIVPDPSHRLTRPVVSICFRTRT